jgi:tripartite-type tricarboxylate transporter receptor subunit TctC
MRRLRRGIALALALSLGGLGIPVSAQETAWPDRPVRLVVPYAPGGPTDIIARLLSRFVGQALGQPVLVDNRAGAGGTIGLASVLKSEPDGYTLALVAPGPVAGMPNLMKLPYGPDDIQYVTLVARTPSVIVVNAATGITSLSGLVREAKQRPGKLNYGSAGAGTTPHLGAELFKQEADVDIVHVAYKGAAPALTALLSGEVQMMMVDLLPILPHIASGRLKVLAVVSAQRVPQIPGVPTTRELGFERVAMDANYGIVGPKGMPLAVQNRIRDAVGAALKTAEMSSELSRLGGIGLSSTSAEYHGLNQAEFEKWKRVVGKGRITLD